MTIATNVACSHVRPTRDVSSISLPSGAVVTKTSPIAAALALLIACTAHAQDADRVAQLEREVQELKQRLAKLEAQTSSPSNPPAHKDSGDGWKSLANWRRLATKMDPDAVRAILGEPQRIHGGNLSFWYYENNGDVSFINGKVSSWTEPRK
jgi:hypothetical protein